jgi:hypothetical protein
MTSKQRIAVTATKQALAITSRWRKTYPITPARTPMADANEQVRAFVLIKGVSAAAGRSSKRRKDYTVFNRELHGLFTDRG